MTDEITLRPIAAVADVLMGQSPPGTACNREGNGMPLLNGPTEFGPRYPTPAQWTTAPTKLARRGDILFCVRGSTTGRMNVADQEYCIGRGVAAIRAETPTDTEFVRYALLGGLADLLTLTAGSVFPNLSTSDIRGFRIPWPDDDQRAAVVDILGALDDKITSNRRASAAISALVPLYFRQMCSTTGSTEPLNELATFRKGVSYRRAELQPSSTAMVTLKCFDRAGGYRIEGLKPYVGDFKPEQEIFPGELAVAQTDLTQAADVVGRVVRVPRAPDFTRLVASLDVAVVRAIEGVPQEYLYAVLMTEEFREHCRSRTSGTTVLHLASDALPSYLVPFVEPADRARFAAATQPLLDARDVLEWQIATLTELRDALLPELLSGRVSTDGTRERAGANA